MIVEIESFKGRSGPYWKVRAPGHSTYHRTVEEVLLLVKILLRNEAEDSDESRSEQERDA